LHAFYQKEIKSAHNLVVLPINANLASVAANVVDRAVIATNLEIAVINALVAQCAD